jgi:UPF0716 protein FxsA
MLIVKWVVIGLLLLPLAELFAFMLVGSLIGWVSATAALVGTSIVGALLLRHTGARELDRLRRALREGGIPALHLDYPPVAKLVGAILLALPGFISGVVGAALFLPPLRTRAASAFLKARTAKAMTAPRQRGDRHDPIIDLKPDEWRRITDRGPGSKKRGRPKAKHGSC